jgi:hypothetical protein
MTPLHSLDASRLIPGTRMKRQINGTKSSRLCWLVVSLLCLCHVVCFAQQGIYGGAQTNPFAQTNYFQSLTNNLLSPPVGPSTPGSAFSGPFLGTSGLAPGVPSLAIYSPTGPPLAAWGPFDLYPHLHYLISYGNGLQPLPGKNSTTLLDTVAPGLYVKIGHNWFVDYTPSFNFYSNPIFHNTTDQKVFLNGATTNGDWTLSLSQHYIDTTQPLVETGTQIEQQAYATALNATWLMSSRSSLELSLNQNFRFTASLVNLHEWTSADWYNYQVQPQLGLALGFTGGFDELSAGARSEPFEEALGRVVFHPGTKLSLTVIGGIQDRQFSDVAEVPLLSPIFQAVGAYQIRDGTLLTVTGDRSVTPSLIKDQLNTITTVDATVHQNIIGKMFAELSCGYTDQSYTGIVPGPLPPFYFGTPPRFAEVVDRVDHRSFAKVSLSTIIQTRFTASIFYMISENESSQSNFHYSGNQGGFQLDYKY